jgi:hypothetical protein
VEKFIRIGVDLAKNYFQVHALASESSPAVKRKFRHPHTGTMEGLGASASSRGRTRSAEKDLKESD